MPKRSLPARPSRDLRAARRTGVRLALAGAVVAVALTGCAAGERGTPPTDPGRGSVAPRASGADGCAATVEGVLRGVAMRVYAQAADGRNVAGSERRLAASRALASAVSRGDRPAVAAALRPLLRSQIQRIVVSRGNRVLASEGTGAALAPVHGVIRDAAGVRVGRYTMSVGEDSGLAPLIRTLTGAQVVMGARAARVSTTPAAAHAVLPASGTATIAGVAYHVSSFSGTAYPAGPLRVWLLSGPLDPALCGRTTAATVTRTLGSVGERLVSDEAGGAATVRVLRVAASDPRLVAAVAADDPAALRSEIVRLFRDPSLHVVRIRAVTADGTLVNDVGGPYVLAPASALLVSHGRVVGRVTLSIQDDAGYIKLMRRFTGAGVVLRTPAGEVPGSDASPAAASGVHGHRPRDRSDGIFSFGASAFPSGPLRITLVVPSTAAAF